MNLSTNPQTTEVFENYPDSVRSQMEKLRELVLEAASEVDSLENLEETLKWGEPSYLTKHGSTVRMDWKEKKPDQYAMYFKCTSKLVPTFKELYQDTFTFEGDRAIIFKLDEKIPKNELKHCIKLALNYHKVKHLLLLGA
jgi:hemoglobin-like flavoprotein